MMPSDATACCARRALVSRVCVYNVCAAAALGPTHLLVGDVFNQHAPFTWICRACVHIHRRALSANFNAPSSEQPCWPDKPGLSIWSTETVMEAGYCWGLSAVKTDG